MADPAVFDHYRQRCRHPVVASMAFAGYAEQLHVSGKPRLPPLTPMIIVLINLDADRPFDVSVKSPGLPAWHRSVISFDAEPFNALASVPVGRLRSLTWRPQPETVDYCPVPLSETLTPSQRTTLEGLQVLELQSLCRQSLLECITASLHALHTLQLFAVPTVDGLQALPNLTHLTLRQCLLREVHCLATAPKLRFLEVFLVASADVEPLSRCVCLEELVVGGVQNVDALAASRTLRRLCADAIISCEALRRYNETCVLEVMGTSHLPAFIAALEVRPSLLLETGAHGPPEKLWLSSTIDLKCAPTLLKRVWPHEVASHCARIHTLEIRFRSSLESFDLALLALLPVLKYLTFSGFVNLVTGSLSGCRTLEKITMRVQHGGILVGARDIPMLQHVTCGSLEQLEHIRGCCRLRRVEILATRKAPILPAHVNHLRTLPALETLLFGECEAKLDVLMPLVSMPSLSRIHTTRDNVPCFSQVNTLLAQRDATLCFGDKLE